MTLAELKMSRALHARRHRFASAKLARVRRGAHTDDVVTAAEAREIRRLERRVREERALVDRREAQIAANAVGRGALYLPDAERIAGNHAGTFRDINRRAHGQHIRALRHPTERTPG